MTIFDASKFGPEVQRILALDGNGARPMPLAPSAPAPAAGGVGLVRLRAAHLFPAARSPEGALSGLCLYFSCLDEAHKIAQDLETREGSYWHGVMHRQEPDAFNAGYWFGRVGRHPIFPVLNEAARNLGYQAGREWDPRRFIDFCETARVRPGSKEEDLAMRVQLVEWQLLFDYCAGAPAGEKI